MTSNPEDPRHTYNDEVLDLLETLEDQRTLRAVRAETPETGPSAAGTAPPADEGGSQSPQHR
jgi:hypothetical protein